MLEQKRMCDNCSKVLRYNDINENYFTLKGCNITVSKYIAGTKRYSQINLVSEGDNDYNLHDFCDVKCFGEWIERRSLEQRMGLYNSYLEASKKDSNILPEHYFIDDEDIKQIKKHLSTKKY